MLKLLQILLQILKDLHLSLQIYLIIIFCIGCIYPLRNASFILLLGILHLNFIIYFFKKHFIFPSLFFSSLAVTICLILIFFTAYFYRKIKETITLFFENKLKKEKNRYRQLVEKNRQIKKNINHLEEEAREISAIYENIKDMNVSLNLTDSLKVFIKAFTELIQFEEGEIILLEKESEKTKIKKIYKISEDFTKEELLDTHLTKKHLLIVEETTVQRKILYSKHFNPTAKQLSETPKPEDEIIFFTAIPLFAEKEIVAILVIKELKEDDLRKILILTTQFALEIKKAYLYEELQALSWFDGLTGLYLSRYFSELVEDEIERALQNKEQLSFLMLDVDYFKKINDQYGHLVGDIVLKNIANIIKNNAREFDILGRYGGDEFIIVLPSAEKKQAFYIAERIKNEVKEHKLSIEDVPEKIQLSVSIGISSFPQDGTDKKMLIDKADFALYRSKKIGKDTVTLFKEKEDL